MNLEKKEDFLKFYDFYLFLYNYKYDIKYYNYINSKYFSR